MTIKLETKNQGRLNHQWDNVTLNSIDAIDILIRFRFKFDEFYLSKYLYTNSIFESNGIPEFVEIIECLYLDLDIYIENARLLDFEKDMIKYLSMGFLFKDVVKIINKKYYFNKDVSGLKKIFRKRICRKILREYEDNYQRCLHTSGKIKVDKNDKYKRCTRCKKYRQTTRFQKSKVSRDKLNYTCNECLSDIRFRYETFKKLDYKLENRR